MTCATCTAVEVVVATKRRVALKSIIYIEAPKTQLVYWLRNYRYLFTYLYDILVLL